MSALDRCSHSLGQHRSHCCSFIHLLIWSKTSCSQGQHHAMQDRHSSWKAAYTHCATLTSWHADLAWPEGRAPWVLAARLHAEAC